MKLGRGSMKTAKFGVAGFPVRFFEETKNREKIFEWLENLGLEVLELQCTYGIRMKEEQALRYKSLAEQHHITLTIHAPYYVCLASSKSETVKRSKLEIKKAYELAKILGVTRIIFHPGGGYQDRKQGLEQLISALLELGPELDQSIHLYPEIGGKIAQLGSLDEIIEICKRVPFAYPCIDLAHLHARELGSMINKEKIVGVLDKIEQELGKEKLLHTHFHVYPVDYTDKGEKIHKAFGDKKEDAQLSLFEEETDYFPKAEDYIEAIKEKGLTPITICEAHNTQDTGALLMKKLYEEN